MDPSMILALLAMGAFGGFAAGLLGIGGGMIMVPFITMVLTARDVPEALVVHMAIATSLATIMFTSLSSVRAHHKHGAVVWRIVKLLSPGIVVGSMIGPWIGKQMNASTLAWFFGAFVAFSATQMLVNKKPAAARDLPGTAGMFGAGGLIGVLAGLVGAGGGFISVPFMTWCGVRIHNAVATSAALGFPIALAGTVANIFYGWGEPGLPEYSLGYIYVPALAIIVAASMTMAPLGARTAHRMPVRQLQKVFAVILYTLAAYMFWKAFQ
ncbi:sulfite exporter TauE/SafE family protein [Massilia sp. CMS3.1]|uniref:sulfite exporter TauE/SafE family protein n=1 Tax=Massilia sp. CMS3.1 TaxID=3373083 RepID=UPI003EE5AA13